MQEFGILRVVTEMLQINPVENPRRWHWCSVIVLIAAISLTLSLATRYGSARACSDSAGTTVQKVSAPEQARQRLLKNAATWVPPAICVTGLEIPVAHTHIVAAGPPIIKLCFGKNLYNRPPPFRNPYLS
jgi:hypothetical protein